MWIALALWTGFTFVGYFTPIRERLAGVGSFAAGPRAVGNLLDPVLRLRHLRQRRLDARAGVQVHVPVCALPERDVRPRHAGHHLRRGARRAARLAQQATDPKAAGLGDCVDCGICVQVCPTGIDIRKGLQYECIGCAACIDGCDQVMDKMGYPRGLIRYSTENAVQRNYRDRDIVRHVLRPRTLVYSAILLAVVAAFVRLLYLRVPLKVDVIRDRAALVRETNDGLIENVYRLQIMNTTEQPRQFVITASGIDGLQLIARSRSTVPAATALDGAGGAARRSGEDLGGLASGAFSHRGQRGCAHQGRREVGILCALKRAR